MLLSVYEAAFLSIACMIENDLLLFQPHTESEKITLQEIAQFERRWNS